MFTGLVESTGALVAVERREGGATISVATEVAPELSDGDSIAVSGVCLTARAVAGDRFSADVMAETLRRTALGQLTPGDRVNLELPLLAGARLGGHVVQGHVDGVGSVASIADDGFARALRLSAPADLLRYVVERGSIAIDGVSLTVSAVHDDALEVSLVPETLERTTLGALTQGQLVNLEVDVLAKYVEKLVPRTVEVP